MARRASLAELTGTDALAEVMSALQMQGRVFCRLELSGEWAFSMPKDGRAHERCSIVLSSVETSCAR